MADKLSRLHLLLKLATALPEKVIAKARDLMNPVLGAGITGKLIDTVLHLETVKNVRDLRPLLQRG